MSKYLRINKLSPLLIILLFLLYKLSHLGVSFFWDESWVYAPALKAMADAGPSLLPDSISLDYSRGHPLLFHFLGGVWIKIFGPGYIAMHTFALLISVGFLLTLDRLLEKIVTLPVRFWTVLLLCVQPLFVAQASMVLPEVLLATLTLASIYCYVSKKYLFYIIAGILTILTKETGILIIGTIVVFDFLSSLHNRLSIQNIMKNGIVLSLPLLALVAHMLYLKSVFGWYLYPEHTGMIKSDVLSILTSFSHVIKDQIFSQKRFLISIPFVVLYVIQLVKTQRFSAIVIVILSLLVSAFAGKFYGSQFTLSILFCVYALHFCLGQFFNGTQKEKVLMLLLFFILIYGLFSAANFYTVRYLLSTFAYTLLIPIYFLLEKCDWRKWMPYYLTLTIPIYIYFLLIPNSTSDVNLSYLDYCPLQMEVVEYFENNNLYDQQINTMFLMSVALKDDKAGYRKTKQTFTFVNTENDKGVDYYIFYNVEDDGRKNGIDGELIKRYESGPVWFEIWKTTDL